MTLPLVIVSALSLSGCAALDRAWLRSVEQHGHCARLCSRYAHIPADVAMSPFAVNEHTCRCEAWLNAFDRRTVASGTSVSTTIECAPSCRALAEALR